ncbi:ATP synthase F1 subunit delta [Anaplasma capra]|uniref:ATP synthase F1 subunit delta n=1 Tax=Anaplasma capra TaxID=1562740 RepID=UPI0021D6132F|nr:ATP synthase F1 subunit delta [Anaplasma capra]MCU7611111.1 ATP synthase F1 subunit delta [Anaplasma capra]
MSKRGGGRVVYCYARALLDVAAGSEDSVCAGIELVHDVLIADADVRAFFSNPVTSKASKIEVLRALVGSCKLSRALVGLICVVVEDGRFDLLSDVFEEFFALLRRARGRCKLEITTAAPVSAAEEKKILGIVRSECGEPETVTKRVDPTVLGGFVAKAGSLVIDASFSGHLRELEKVSKSVICGVDFR